MLAQGRAQKMPDFEADAKQGQWNTAMDASAEELLACARLLAASLAQHRARCGVIPLTPPGSTTAPLASAVDATLSEALVAVRAQAQSAREVPAAGGVDDHRRQLRISVNAAVELAQADGSAARPASLRNISWGGAAVCCADMPGAVGDRVCLLLPFGRTERIAIVATVLRSIAIDGEREYGLRFDSLSPSDELRLQRILSILMSDPQTTGRRSEARLVQRLEIEYGDAGELRATLEDISASGLMLTVPEPLTIDQSLLISLSCADANCSLDLRGRVVHQTAVEAGDYTAYRVGLRLEHPTPELRTQVTEMLHHLASLPPSAHFTSAFHTDGA